MMQKHTLVHAGPFSFESGNTLENISIDYFTSPRPYREGEKVVWICHALTGNADPADWWPQMVGEGKLFDPDKVYMVSVAMLCSPYGSCGPASGDRPMLLDFPRTTVRDMVKAAILVREHLGIESIDLMIGPSIGGFLMTEWIVTEPDRIRYAALLASGSRVTPFMTAFNESQRLALLADPTFKEARSLDGGKAGLACARSIALISYRTYDGYNVTQAEPDTDTLFADRAASYQRYQGKKLVDRFDAYSYWYLTYALDSQNIGRGRGGVDAALARVKAKCLVVSIDSDVLFPPAHGRAFAAAVPNASYVELTSRFGHDGFLIENEALVGAIRPFVEEALGK